MKKGYWKTRERKLIKISDMTPEHRNNAVRMLEKNINEIEFAIDTDEHLMSCSFSASLATEELKKLKLKFKELLVKK